jgi:hypothetical protein
MKTRLFLATFFLTAILLATYRHETSIRAVAAPAAGTYVSEAEALQALAHGRLIPTAGAAHLTQRDPSPQFPAVPDSLAGKIAFSSNRNGNFHDLYYYDVALNEVITATSILTAHDVTPVWSPDGTQLLFASDREGFFDIYLMQFDSSIVTNLTAGSMSHDFHPSWSPDGQHILFSSNRGGSYYQIYRMDIDGGNVQQVAVVPGNNAFYARYSPDGSKIAFMRASVTIVACDWNWDVWLMNANGSNQQQITTHLGGDFYPNWLPDGSGIIYGSCRNFLFSDLYRVNLTTMVETRITFDAWSSQWNGVYSPDGDYIAYNSNKNSPADILIQSVDGLPVNRGITGPAEDLAPSWYAPSVGSVIRGRVLDFAGNPTAEVRVNNGQGRTAVTDLNGVYLFANLIPGTYTLWVENHTYHPLSDETITIPPGRYDIDFMAKDCSRATAYPPVMLITGWGGSEDGLLVEDEQMRYFTTLGIQAGHLTAHGYVPGCNLFYAQGTSPRLWLTENAEIIKGELCRYYDDVHISGRTWSGEFDLIVHSYGGLRARAYLENINLYATTCEGTTNLIRVGNLFTMGTPHGGELPILPFSVFIGAGAILGGQWPAIYEMMPPVRLLANLQSAQPPDGICYRLLAGDGRFQAATYPTLLLPIFHKWPAAAALPNDLAVHQLSAHALALNAWLYPNTSYIFTPDLHGQVPSWIDPLQLLHSFVNPGLTFESEILPMIGETDCPVLGGIMAASDTGWSLNTYPEQHPASRLKQPQQSEAVPMLDIAAGLLNGNELATGVFTITNDGPTSVSLYWFDQELALTLTDPLGNPISSASSSSDPNVDYIYIDTGFGLMASFHITDTLTGQWAYTIAGQNLPEETLYRLLILPATPVAVSSSVPEWAPFGSPVTITATVSHGESTPVAGGVVSGVIRRPDGAVHHLVLYDDGQHNDGAANDGVFGAQYGQTNLGGLYGLHLTAEGTYADEPYTRNATAVFTIAPNTAALTGQYSDAGVDVNGNGLYNWLEVQVGLHVTGASTYTLSAEIYHGSTFVAHASNRLYLQPGTQSVPLRFSGDTIRARQLDGPYLVRNVIVTDNAMTTILVETSDNVHTTAPYLYEQFGSKIELFLPIIRKP